MNITKNVSTERIPVVRDVGGMPGGGSGDLSRSTLPPSPLSTNLRSTGTLEPALVTLLCPERKRPMADRAKSGDTSNRGSRPAPGRPDTGSDMWTRPVIAAEFYVPEVALSPANRD